MNSRSPRLFLCVFLTAVLVASLLFAVFSTASSTANAQNTESAQDEEEFLDEDQTDPNFKFWDTDNIDFRRTDNTRIGAGDFGIPSFKYDKKEQVEHDTGNHSACVTGAPGFYQTPHTTGVGSTIFLSHGTTP